MASVSIHCKLIVIMMVLLCNHLKNGPTNVDHPNVFAWIVMLCSFVFISNGYHGALNSGNLLMAGFMSFSNRMALLIVDLLPETRAHREKLQENMRRAWSIRRFHGPFMVHLSGKTLNGRWFWMNYYGQWWFFMMIHVGFSWWFMVVNGWLMVMNRE